MKAGKLVLRNLGRRPLRTAFTIVGVASALVLLLLVHGLSRGVDAAFAAGDTARSLVVYRQNRYCPQTSLLPERYAARIAQIDGVTHVLPVKVWLSNCRASLDVVTFHGAPVDRMFDARDIDVVNGDVARFRAEKDGALVGAAFAARRSVGVGDRFRFGKIDVKVDGVFRSNDPVAENTILTHLEYLQRSGPVNQLGTVTQFEVKVADASRAEAIAAEIDAAFRSDEAPTDTRPRVLYLEGATRDLREILSFARGLGLASMLVILVLVANTVLMAVSERGKEIAVLRTLGFRERGIALLVCAESVALAAAGGVLGAALAALIVRGSRLSIASEGVSISADLSPSLFLGGVLVAAVAGVLAGLYPAIRSARVPVAAALKAGAA